MGKQEGTVRGLQFRAIAALRRELDVTVEPIAGGRELRLSRRAGAANDG
jgi:hypothetical protein